VTAGIMEAAESRVRRLVRLSTGSIVDWFDCRLVRLSTGSIVDWFDCRLSRLLLLRQYDPVFFQLTVQPVLICSAFERTGNGRVLQLDRDGR
jgi:hypothetical protein